MHFSALLIAAMVLLVLLLMERETGVRTSKALWIPVVWMMIVGSRPVSFWTSRGAGASIADQLSSGSPVDAAIYGLLIAAGVVALNMRSRHVRQFLRINTPILLFFAFCLVSVLWSDYSFVALKRWVKAVGDFVMVLVVLTDPNPRAAIKRFFFRPAFLLMPMSIILILFFRDLSTFSDSLSGVTYYSGVTTDKNTLGVTCIFCGLGAMWMLMDALHDRSTPFRARFIVMDGLLYAMALGLVLRADSMTSLSCLAIGSVFLIASANRQFVFERNSIHGLVAAAIALPVIALFIDSAGSLVRTLGRDTSLTGRTGIWDAVLSLHTNPLVGTGFESFWLGDRLQQIWTMTHGSRIQEAHNGYIELYLNLGFIGIVLLAFIAVSGYRQAFLMLGRDSKAGRLRMVLLIACLIYSLTEAGFRMMSPVWIGLLFATTLVPAKYQIQAGEPALAKSRRKAFFSERVRILQ